MSSAGGGGGAGAEGLTRQIVSRGYPLGFESRDEFEAILERIRTATGVDDAQAGIRGSSVTGRSYKEPERQFGPKSDLDFFVVSDTLYEQAVARGAKPANGLINVRETARFPELRRLERQLTTELG